MDPLTDKNGFKFFDQLPENFRLATIEDFHSNGRKKIGMEFLIKWVKKEYYQVCIVSESLTGAFLKPFITDNRVFIEVK